MDVEQLNENISQTVDRNCFVRKNHGDWNKSGTFGLSSDFSVVFFHSYKERFIVNNVVELDPQEKAEVVLLLETCQIVRASAGRK